MQTTLCLTLQEAAMEKVTAGENRAVEHVALIDEYSTSQALRKKGKVLQP